MDFYVVKAILGEFWTIVNIFTNIYCSGYHRVPETFAEPRQGKVMQCMCVEDKLLEENIHQRKYWAEEGPEEVEDKER